jgi:hypothetical protein
MKQSYSEKKEQYSASYPRASYAFSYVKEVWDETFPNETKKVVTKLNKRKEIARQQKEMEDN